MHLILACKQNSYYSHEANPPLASSTWPERSVPSGNVRDTISLYLGNLTWRSSVLAMLPPLFSGEGRGAGGTNIVKDNQRAIDSSDSVIANAWLDGGHPGIEHLGCHYGGGRMYTPSSTQVAGRWVRSRGGVRSCRSLPGLIEGEVEDRECSFPVVC